MIVNKIVLKGQKYNCKIHHIFLDTHQKSLKVGHILKFISRYFFDTLSYFVIFLFFQFFMNFISTFYFTETKGGYLQGKLYLPRHLSENKNETSTKRNYFLRLSLGPATPDPESNAFHIHPLLLYLNTRQNRRNRQSKVNDIQIFRQLIYISCFRGKIFLVVRLF